MMTQDDKIKELQNARKKFDDNLAVAEATFGKDTPNYNICREVGLAIFKEEIAVVLKSPQQ